MKKLNYTITLLLCILFQFQTIAQAQLVDDLKSKDVLIETDYLDVVIFTWDKDYIEVSSSLKINMQPGNEYHDLQIRNTSDGIEIESNVDVDGIPQMVITTDKEGNKTYIPVDEWNEKNNRKQFGRLNYGYEIDGNLAVYLPKKLLLTSHSTYGDFKIEGAYASIKIHSTYGQIDSKLSDINKMDMVSLKSTYDFVDLTIDKSTSASINVKTSYGSVYTDLPLKSEGKTHASSQSCNGHKSSYVLNGGDVQIDLVATYDNIYLRTRS